MGASSTLSWEAELERREGFTEFVGAGGSMGLTAAAAYAPKGRHVDDTVHCKGGKEGMIENEQCRGSSGLYH